ncbi:small lysine-rich protein 1 [Heterocephalus glaber]|uniref:Small lysine-rich protein 1 n=1 Tax=Heterocephalus glaber TaxID=10181 RepID=A0AAX6PPI0_HETGA|nr:small lysine-rich protein 1 [Heterocephalus glaber]
MRGCPGAAASGPAGLCGLAPAVLSSFPSHASPPQRPVRSAADPPAAGVGSRGRTHPRGGTEAAMPGKGKRGKGLGKPRGKKQKKPEVDILSPAAMLNLYYIAHNAADCLQLRGFRWPGAPRGKRGKNKT